MLNSNQRNQESQIDRMQKYLFFSAGYFLFFGDVFSTKKAYFKTERSQPQLLCVHLYTVHTHTHTTTATQLTKSCQLCLNNQVHPSTLHSLCLHQSATWFLHWVNTTFHMIGWYRLHSVAQGVVYFVFVVFALRWSTE